MREKNKRNKLLRINEYFFINFFFLMSHQGFCNYWIKEFHLIAKLMQMMNYFLTHLCHRRLIAFYLYHQTFLFDDNCSIYFRFQASKETRPSKTKVLVVSGQKNMLDERLKLVNELWEKNIEVSFFLSIDVYISLNYLLLYQIIVVLG